MNGEPGPGPGPFAVHAFLAIKAFTEVIANANNKGLIVRVGANTFSLRSQKTNAILLESADIIAIGKEVERAPWL